MWSHYATMSWKEAVESDSTTVQSTKYNIFWEEMIGKLSNLQNKIIKTRNQ